MSQMRIGITNLEDGMHGDVANLHFTYGVLAIYFANIVWHKVSVNERLKRMKFI